MGIGIGSKRRSSRRSRPEVALLEDRLLLSTLMVDDDKVQCPKADFTSIQAAVTAAKPGDTIKVCPGTYNEQVTIPAGKDKLALISEKPLQAIINAPAGSQANVYIAGARGVTVEDFAIRGPALSGVRVDGGGSAEVQGNDIRNYQEGGVTDFGAGSDASIERNTIVGLGTASAFAKNGIEIGFGATARVRMNDVSGNVFAPQTLVATGIGLFQAGAVTVDHNTVGGNDVGIGSFSTANPVITHNEISGSIFDGIELRVDDVSGATTGTTGALVSHNSSIGNGFDGIYVEKSTGNTIDHNELDENGEDGIQLLNGSSNNTIDHNQAANNGRDGIRVDATSMGNGITQNRMSDNDEHDCHDDSVGTGTAGTANFWSKNQGQTENRPGLCEGGKGKGGKDKPEKQKHRPSGHQ